MEVLKELRVNKNDTKVIIVTGSEDEKTVSETNRWGINGFIHKPLILEELERIVSEQIEK